MSYIHLKVKEVTAYAYYVQYAIDKKRKVFVAS